MSSQAVEKGSRQPAKLPRDPGILVRKARFPFFRCPERPLNSCHDQGSSRMIKDPCSMMTMGAEQCLQDVPAALAQGQRLDVFPATTEVISDILALFWRHRGARRCDEGGVNVGKKDQGDASLGASGDGSRSKSPSSTSSCGTPWHRSTSSNVSGGASCLGGGAFTSTDFSQNVSALAHAPR